MDIWDGQPSTWPEQLQTNAWAGPDGIVSDAAGREVADWGLDGRGEHLPTLLAPDAPADMRDWLHPDVGWGLVLPDRDDLGDADKATGEDAPDPLRRLLKARGDAPVLRYRPISRYTFLRRYFTDRPSQDVSLSGSKPGKGARRLPAYLLIAAGPDEIPWDFQYLANQPCFVGRLPLKGEALENYVNALLAGWPDAPAQPTRTVVWAVDHDAQDISHLMRLTIAAPLQQSLSGDDEIGTNARYLDGGKAEASAGALEATLAEHSPGLIVTTSHGMTGPVTNPVAMTRDLGLPVDQNGEPVKPERLLSVWQPAGAVWYSHACCSAGSDSTSIFEGLLPSTSPVDRLLRAIAGLGTLVAPLPLALLGAPNPLRAFVGHVEPTFDWTIRHRDTGQPLTSSICDALYTRLMQPEPIGHAMRGCYAHIGPLYAQRDAAYRAFERGEDTEAIALATQLAARDRQSMVILGDPAVALPPLPSRA